MHESYIVILISDDDGIEVGEDFEISDEFIDGKVPDLRGIATATDGEDSDGFFLATQVKLVLLIGILEMFDHIHMHKLAEFSIS